MSACDFQSFFYRASLYNPVGYASTSSFPLMRLASTVSELFVDLLRFMNVALRSRSSLIVENLFLRKQLAFYREHEVKPRRLTDAARISLVLWSR